MALARQLILALGVVVVAGALWGRFVPASHPVLERIGLLAPMRAVGVIAPAPGADAAPATAGRPGGAPGAGGGPPGGARAAVVTAQAPGDAAAFDSVTAIGTGQALRSVTVTSEVAGRIAEVAVLSGHKVAAGEVIARLEREGEEIARARADLVLADARARFERVTLLRAAGSATDLQIREAELALRQAELAVRQAAFDLTRRDIRAPIAGWVGIVSVEPGRQVTAATDIARIDDRAEIVVEFRLPERFVGQIKPGDPVTALPLARPEVSLTGVISALDNRVDEASRTLLVQARLGNDDDLLRAGMSFSIALAVTGDRYPTVDPLSVQWGSSGAFVWVVRAEKAVRVPVRIVQRMSDTVLVQAAFEAGDLVVIEGVQALRPGGAVTLRGDAPVQSGAREAQGARVPSKI